VGGRCREAPPTRFYAMRPRSPPNSPVRYNDKLR
jgi:hypothetical protein